ncbi:hypothetical protein MASR2M15_21080 [Anaerolineales bacterium]
MTTHMTTYEERVEQLASAINFFLPKVQRMLDERKQQGEALLKRDDFVWQALLNSMSTWGKFRYSELMENEALYSMVVYDSISGILDHNKRHEILLEAFTEAGLRYQTSKAKYMTLNYNLIQEKGGIDKAKQEYLSKSNIEEKKQFWKAFHGIGPKYSRNIPMDIYDKDFRDSIAVDERLKGIAEKLGFKDKEQSDYALMERFFLDVAKECKLTGWEIDRILFNYVSCVHLVLEN